MAFDFNQQAPAQAQGIASLPAQSSAQGGFAFQPRQAVQHPNTLPQAQPLSNEQLGIKPAGAQNQGDAFARSMQAWQAARQAELAGLTPATPARPVSYNYSNMGGHMSLSNPFSSYGIGRGAASARVAKPVAPTVPTFNLGALPTDPQQYMSYVTQQQAEFEKQKAAYQKALDSYKG